jgi:hypothetical protein
VRGDGKITGRTPGQRRKGIEVVSRVRPAARALASITVIMLLLPGPEAAGQAVGNEGYRAPRTADGKPDLNGIWQVLNTASWDLQDHSARDGVPAGQGVVEGNEIPYKPEAAAKKKENFEKGPAADPLAECFLPGVPRATYLPFPFQIAQTPKTIAMLFEWSRTTRIIYADGSNHPDGLEFWMGDSRATWEGETLVVDVKNFNGRTWFDRAGNFHSNALHLIERFTRIGPDHLQYEVSVEDPEVFTRPWNMRMILYRRIEPHLRVLEYECLEFLEAQRYQRPAR